jgi:DNA-directed RNA polymerase sigma subunit (sigma70/sigma32)
MNDKTLSLNAQIKEDVSSATFFDALQSPYCPPLEKISRADTIKTLHNALDTLDAQERSILSARFALNAEDEIPLRSIAKSEGLVLAKVQKIDSKARKKLRHILECQGIACTDDATDFSGHLSWDEPQP